MLISQSFTDLYDINTNQKLTYHQYNWRSILIYSHYYLFFDWIYVRHNLYYWHLKTKKVIHYYIYISPTIIDFQTLLCFWKLKFGCHICHWFWHAIFNIPYACYIGGTQPGKIIIHVNSEAYVVEIKVLKRKTIH